MSIEELAALPWREMTERDRYGFAGVVSPTARIAYSGTFTYIADGHTLVIVHDDGLETHHRLRELSAREMADVA